MIEKLSEIYPVKTICAAVGVARSSYYQWQKPRSCKRQQENEQLLREIRLVHSEHRERLGSPRMTHELRRRGHACGRHRVARLMRRHGLRARRKRAFRPKTTQPGKTPCANLLKERARAAGARSRLDQRHHLCRHQRRLALPGRRARSLQPQAAGMGIARHAGSADRHHRVDASIAAAAACRWALLPFRSRCPVRQRSRASTAPGNPSSPEHER